MDAIKRKARAAKKACEARNLRFFQSLCARWGQFSTIAVWEIAALMQGCDPDNLQDVVINDQGDGVDLSHENRMLMSAITVGDLVAYSSNIDPPSSETEVNVKTLIPWLYIRGFQELADGLANALNCSTLVTSDVSVVATTTSTSKPAIPIPRFTAQETAILNKLTELEFDPLQLPTRDPGKPWVKAAIKTALGTTGMWAGTRVFEKAWDRLRSDKRIASKG